MFNLIYLFSRLYSSEKTFLLIPLLSLGLGLSLLFSSFCVFHGLHQDFYRQIETNHAHYILEPKEGYFFYDSEFIQSEIKRRVPEAKIDQILLTQGLLNIGDRASGIFLRGEPELGEPVQDEPNVQISKSLAFDLQITAGQSAEMVLADGSHHDVLIKKIFDDYKWPELKHTVKMNLELCQTLLFEDQMVNRFEVKFPHLFGENNDSLMSELENQMNQIRVISWKEVYSETLLLFDTEKWLHIFFLALFCAFLAVSTYASFTLVFLRKQSSLKSLHALGWSRNQERNFLVISSHLLILMALVLGILLSLTIKLGLSHFPLKLPQSLFYSAIVPFNWQWSFLYKCSIFIYLTSIIAIFLAWREVFLK